MSEVEVGESLYSFSGRTAATHGNRPRVEIGLGGVKLLRVRVSGQLGDVADNRHRPIAPNPVVLGLE